MKKFLKYVILLSVTVGLGLLTRKLYMEIGIVYMLERWERVFYVAGAILFTVLACDIAERIRTIWGKVLVVSGISLFYTVVVFLLNNYWRFIVFVYHYHWEEPRAYAILLRQDLRYARGIGAFRYPLLFLGLVTMCAGVLFIKRLIKEKNYVEYNGDF